MRAITKHYRVKHLKSSPYYPQGNGQAEITNRMLLHILSKMVFDYSKNWGFHLPDVLWAYQSSPKTTTGFSPFLLVYGIEAIAPVEIVILTPRVVQGTENDVDASMCAKLRTYDLEALKEAKNQALEKTKRYHLKMVGAYGKIVKERIFATGQLVLKATNYVRRGLPSPSKFVSNWEGPYVIRKAHASGPSEWEVVETLLCLDSRGGKPFVFTLPTISKQGYISHGKNSFVLTLPAVLRQGYVSHERNFFCLCFSYRVIARVYFYILFPTFVCKALTMLGLFGYHIL